MTTEKVKSESYALLGGINSKASAYNNGPMEFRDLTNLNFVVPGALSKRPGSTGYLGATVSGRITGGVEFERLNGASYLIVTANTTAYNVTGSFSAFKTGLLNNALFDFVTFVDRLFGANGQDFFRYDGSAASSYSLPPGATGWGVTAVAGGSLLAGVTGTFVAAYGYQNDRGFYGPVSNGITITLDGTSVNSIRYYGLTTIGGYGASAIALYRTSAGGADLVGTTLLSVGSTLVVDTGFTLSTRLGNQGIGYTLFPRFMEIYNNSLFMGGMSALPSTVAWSSVGEPEEILPEYTGEFRTNDGDKVTGLRAYNGSLIVTKERSFHRVTGDAADNYQFQEVSDQYGCLSNRALVVFNDLCWFLDPKGVVEFNGANVRVVSDKVEPVFLSMNVSAARDNAIAFHNRAQNEVWFAIPCNGASYNNCILVYDYLAEAWTKYEGVDVSSLWLAKGSLSVKSPFVGGYTGSIMRFGSSLLSDSGNAITCMMDTRFLSPTGQTTERMFRRFYLDVNPVLGITQAITTNFRQDFGSSIVLTRTMYQAPFQSRIDFGISAKSIAAQCVHASATLSLQINGYTFESRFLRPV